MGNIRDDHSNRIVIALPSRGGCSIISIIIQSYCTDCSFRIGLLTLVGNLVHVIFKTNSDFVAGIIQLMLKLTCFIIPYQIVKIHAHSVIELLNAIIS